MMTTPALFRPDLLLETAPPPDFHAELLQAGARYLVGDEGALDGFLRRHFHGLLDRRDRAAATLALHHAVCAWLPHTSAAEGETRVRAAVHQAIARARAVEQHWQAGLVARLPSGADEGDPFAQAEARVEVDRVIACLASAEDRALLRTLAAADDGWSSVRRQLPPDLRSTDETFFRWQRAARQRLQRRLTRFKPG